MTDGPIMFSAPMVRALLADRKTQTRRLASSPLNRRAIGDRLYVREHWRGRERMDGYAPRELTADRSRICYVADEPRSMPETAEWSWGKHRQSMHMPRWASRLTLTVTGNRIERLWQLTEADAIDEGVYPEASGQWSPHEQWEDGEFLSPGGAYAALWDSLRPAEGQRWADNPEVLVLSFTVQRANIDALR